MLKVVLIDSNCTLEDDTSFDNADKVYFREIADILNCNIQDVHKFRQGFYQSYGKNVWEYHEIFWRSLANNFGYKNNSNIIERLYKTFLDFYENVIELYPNTLEALKKLKSKYTLVMVANGNAKRLLRLIKKFQLNDYFDDYVISSESPYKKPDKFMFEYAVKKYDCAPNEVLMIGDRYDNDIKGAQRCGINTALILRKGNDCLEKQDEIPYIGYSLEEIVMQVINDQPIKTAFIVAGGKGSRLGELGKERQKCMMPIWDNKPILQYVFETLKKNGCTHFVVAVSHLKEQIMSYFGDGHDFGMQIEYIEGQFQSTYDAIYHSLPSLSEKFIYMHGDILFDPVLIQDLNRQSVANDSSCIAVINNKNIHLTHAQMDLNENRKVTAVDLTERDEHYPYTFLGVGVYYKSDFLENYDGNNLGMVEKFIAQKLKKGENICAAIYEGEWRHFETVFDYEIAKNEKEWAVIKNDK